VKDQSTVAFRMTGAQQAFGVRRKSRTSVLKPHDKGPSLRMRQKAEIRPLFDAIHCTTEQTTFPRDGRLKFLQLAFKTGEWIFTETRVIAFAAKLNHATPIYQVSIL